MNKPELVRLAGALVVSGIFWAALFLLAEQWSRRGRLSLVSGMTGVVVAVAGWLFMDIMGGQGLAAMVR